MNNTGIRRVGFVLLALFVGLALQITYLQVFQSESLSANPNNHRDDLRDIKRPRGPVVSADGTVLAKSEPVDDDFKYQRVYPTGTADLFAHVVGYQSVQIGASGVERAYGPELVGRSIPLQAADIADVFAERQPVGTVVLTLSTEIQRVAAEALQGRRGSVVVLDVQTGATIAAYSNPTYDPNLLVQHNVGRAAEIKTLLDLDKQKPLLPRAWAEIFPPGSTFKTVTASVAQQNNVDIDTVFPRVRSITLPQTNGEQLYNFGKRECGGDMFQSFVQSCNTSFAQVGFDLGDTLATGVQRFGVQADPPNTKTSGIDPPIAKSVGPEPGTFRRRQAEFMKDAIGQQDVAVTPMGMALVAEAIATGGVIYNPYFVQCVKDPDNRVVQTVGRTEYKRAIDPATAATVSRFMVGVVNQPNGTGTGARIPGVLVAGKTGTAELDESRNPHAWFIAFAPAAQPRWAVSVIVENGGTDGMDDSATGGKVAAPIAKTVLQALLAAPPTASQCPAG